MTTIRDHPDFIQRPRRPRRPRHGRKRFRYECTLPVGLWFAAACVVSGLDSHNAAGNKIVTMDMHPTAQLLVERRRDLKEIPEEWFHPQSTTVYATLPKVADTNSTIFSSHHQRALQDFHAHRHLSRYERQYRIHHQVHLESNWDGIYRFDDKVKVEQDESHHNSTHMRTRSLQTPADAMYQVAPLSQGYGTHYANVWVGTPIPQRKSVIIDTGSHYTAFPCKGCDDCGESHHTDPYFDFDKSATFRTLSCDECQLGAACRKNQCAITQSYTEGSSWEAFQAEDMFYCGGKDVLASADPIDQAFAIPFMFGCQTSETGLFITQLADGIMGMSAHEFTLTKNLFDKGKIPHNMFALCFRRELGTSKRGVTAGVMTLGGMDNRLDSSPMMYANNVAKAGWFTVYVKNIFIRANGGPSATSILEDGQHVLKIPLDLDVVNSGKGVIVDSGTTDTYLHKKLAKSFAAVWKQVTGLEYSHNGISLTQEQLRLLPTILVQCRASDLYQSLESPDSVIGLVGSLDPTSPNDLLIAIPASNYMEYSLTTNQYTSRLYFTETRGGVLGANAMQGHNVVFDWEKGRIGFAESTCEYRGKFPFLEGITEGNNLHDDCALETPRLSQSCVESVDVSICQGDANYVLQGTETWVRTITSRGTEGGMSCEDVATVDSNYSGSQPPKVVCDNHGLCTEVRQCALMCADVPAALVAVQPQEITPGKGTEFCDETWSACDYSCMQSRLVSFLDPGGTCHEQGRATRPCHIGVCGRADPCRVPFMIHAILGFKGADAAKWSDKSEEMLELALVQTVHRMTSGVATELFAEGDVDVLMASPWLDVPSTNQQDEANDSEIGLKLVIQISIWNPKAMVASSPNHDNIPPYADTTEHPPPHNRFLGKEDLGKEAAEQAQQATCVASDLYPLAKNALDVHGAIEQAEFMSTLIGTIKRIEGGDQNFDSSPLQALYSRMELVGESRVISAWTIRTEGKDDEISYLTGVKGSMALRRFPSISPVTIMVICVFLVLVILGACWGSEWAQMIKRKLCLPRVNDSSEDEERTKRGRKKQDDAALFELLMVTESVSGEDDSSERTTRRGNRTSEGGIV